MVVPLARCLCTQTAVHLSPSTQQQRTWLTSTAASQVLHAQNCFGCRIQQREDVQGCRSSGQQVQGSAAAYTRRGEPGKPPSRFCDMLCTGNSKYKRVQLHTRVAETPVSHYQDIVSCPGLKPKQGAHTHTHTHTHCRGPVQSLPQIGDQLHIRRRGKAAYEHCWEPGRPCSPCDLLQESLLSIWSVSKHNLASKHKAAQMHSDVAETLSVAGLYCAIL